MNELEKLEDLIRRAHACVGATAYQIVTELKGIDLSKLTPGVPELPEGFGTALGWMPKDVCDDWRWRSHINAQWHRIDKLTAKGEYRFVWLNAFYDAGGLMARPIPPIPTPPPVPYSPQFGDAVRASKYGQVREGKFIAIDGEDIYILEAGIVVALPCPPWLPTPILPEPAEPEVKEEPVVIGSACTMQQVADGHCGCHRQAVVMAEDMGWDNSRHMIPAIRKDLMEKRGCNADPRKEKGGSQ